MEESMLYGLLVSTAHAQSAAPGGQPSAFEMFVPFIFIFVIFYFLIIRPQSKRQKEHQKFLTEIKRGDEVVTSSGILGRVEGITEQFVTLEIADGVKVKMLRSQIATSQKAATQEEKK
ncbi:preprotein translocase YajC subunit [Bdellovibrio bacteriovorus HD100]|uniref:Sec translocon accessory complex subunit YajC n=3 Tax=Bdellovibrio bacteriovorus TaxID=959 RepID=Q6MKZ1_BDEBA|nr:preprotein translocase subunit YajC [Bdellovibrio bacteriovorus]CAE80066.1 preprotein translocase YajC subunit [Bdellovibrio bacteriovorus HD100]